MIYNLPEKSAQSLQAELNAALSAHHEWANIERFNCDIADTSDVIGLMGRSESGSEKNIILMCGLPSSGKSYSARKLVGSTGVICEFDQYFYQCVGNSRSVFNWSNKLVPDAHRWNLARFKEAVDAGISPVVVDDNNGVFPTTRQYVAYALESGYEIRIEQPESPWWLEIRRLLEDKHANKELLYTWARKLEAMSRKTHRVPLSLFLRRINAWRNDINVENIMGFNLDSRVKSQICDDKAVFKMREMGINNSYDAGVNLPSKGSYR